MRKRGITLTVLILVVMAELRVTDLRSSRAQTLAVAQSRASNLSLILAEYLGGTFASSDAVLRQITVHSRLVGGPAAPDAEWASLLSSSRAGVTGLGGVTVVDDRGVIVHSTRNDIVGQSRRDDYVTRELLATSTEDVLVGTPFLTVGVNSPTMIIPMGRRLADSGGHTVGAVIASFVPAAPHGLFKSVDVGSKGIIWVFHRQGVVLAREPLTSDPIGQSARNNPLYIAAAGETQSGMFQGVVTDGGASTISAFRKVAAGPLIVAVSLDRGEVLGSWRNEAIQSTGFFAASVLILVGLLLVVHRQTASAERARRDAEAAGALKDEFLMTLSHELRTPLTAIYGWARMLNQGAVSEARREKALQAIERNAHVQTLLIEDLLDVSAAINGTLRLDVRRVAVSDVVQAAVETLGPAADAKAITVQVNIDPIIGSIAADPARFQQVVWNLLLNAVKFTPPGGRVDVAARRLVDGIEVTVADTGIGIAADFLPHVFERFRQADAGTTRETGGLGLGLSIARRLVEMHGGTIDVYSAGTGHGARFTVRLPVEPTDLAHEASPETAAPALSS